MWPLNEQKNEEQKSAIGTARFLIYGIFNNMGFLMTWFFSVFFRHVNTVKLYFLIYERPAKQQKKTQKKTPQFRARRPCIKNLTVDIRNWQKMQFLTRNPIFNSKMTNC